MYEPRFRDTLAFVLKFALFLFVLRLLLRCVVT